MFENFYGNRLVAESLERMIESGRIPQTLLFAGPEGVGKATLARRFAARLLGAAEKIEQDDLSREENIRVIADREKWTSEKRGDDPLLFSTHPDFVTFCPEGPLRQLSIQQMRLVRERAQLRPLQGRHRVFLIDHFDRASGQATDSLLKTLEEPPPHLILILTAENAFDLLPTIRSRSIQFHLSPLSDEEMRAFAAARKLPDAARRVAVAAGSPGLAASVNLAQHDKRRGVMLALLESASGQASFGVWARQSESMLASKSEKLDLYFKSLYSLLSDLLLLRHGDSAQQARLRNSDIRDRLAALAVRIQLEWLIEATAQVDELIGLQRRNVQKGLSLDRFVTSLRQSG
jgi:DNA polymerase-3 subunit delta'